MKLLDLVEILVKNPLLDVSILDSLMLNKNLLELYRNSDTHRIRELIAKRKIFPDLAHVIAYSNKNYIPSTTIQEFM